MTPEKLQSATGCAMARAAVLAAPISAAMAKWGIDTPIRKAAFLAQVAHESGMFAYMSEIWGPTPAQRGYGARADLGNTKPEAIAAAKARGIEVGRFYAGHGPIQVTGYDNHLACGKALGIDAVNHPELLATPQYGAESAAWFWSTRNLNAIADTGNQELLCRRINGGLNGLDNRKALYTKCCAALGVA